MKIFYDNLIDYPGVVITASSEDTLLPAKNVSNEQIKKVWRTSASASTHNITFDLGSAKSVTSFVLASVNFLGTELGSIAANSADSWGSPPFTQVFGPPAGLNTKSVTFAQQTYRYWRFTWDQSGQNASRDLGRIFLGTYDDWGDFDYDAFQEETIDPSPVQRSVGGQTYSDLREKYLSLKFSWPHMLDSTRVLVQNTVNKVGRATPLFIEQELGSRANKPIYVKLRDLPRPKFAALDNLTYWAVAATFDEQI